MAMRDYKYRKYMCEFNNSIPLHFPARRNCYYYDLFAPNGVEFQNGKYKYVHNASCFQFRRLGVTVLISTLCNPNINNKVQNENML